MAAIRDAAPITMPRQPDSYGCAICGALVIRRLIGDRSFAACVNCGVGYGPREYVDDRAAESAMRAARNPQHEVQHRFMREHHPNMGRKPSRSVPDVEAADQGAHRHP